MVHHAVTSLNPLQGLLCHLPLWLRVNIKQLDRVYFPSALERVQLIVHHPAVLEYEAVLSVNGSAWTGGDECLRGVQWLVQVHLWLWLRFLDYRQRPVNGACKCAIRVHLHPFEVVWQVVGVVGLIQQVSVHHRVIYGLVDVGVVFRSAFGEVVVAWAEDIPFAHVDGRVLVRPCFFLFPV